jgi:hypothetical protein
MARYLTLSAIACFVFSGTTAEAAIVTVGIPQPSGGAFDFLGAGDASINYDGVTFLQSSSLSNGNFYNVGTAYSGSAAVVSSQQQSVGVPNIKIALPYAVTDLSIKFGTFNGSDVTFAIAGGVSTMLPSTGSGYLALDVYNSGLQPLFTSIILSSSASDILDVSSISFGTPTPEPAAWATMVIGLGAVGAAMRRRRSVRVAYS